VGIVIVSNYLGMMVIAGVAVFGFNLFLPYLQINTGTWLFYRNWRFAYNFQEGHSYLADTFNIPLGPTWTFNVSLNGSDGRMKAY